LTVVATSRGAHPWRHRHEAETPDVFTLDTFLKLSDYPRFLDYLIESRGIDTVLVTHSQMGYQLLPYLRARHPRLRVLDYIHIEEEQWKSGGYPRFAINYRNFLDVTVASSEHLRQWVVERGGEASKVRVVTTNIDPCEWVRESYDVEALRVKYGVRADVPVIAFVGRICAQKQPRVLAEVLLELHRRGLAFQALVAGDGEDGAMLREFVAVHGLTEVTLLGSRSNHEVREILAVSDIFFLPSQMEGISLALYEAMAMGLVVVGADVGGQAELVNGETGVLVQRGPRETEEYAQALAALLEDDARRREMVAAARRRVAEHFTLDEMGDRMAEILDGLPREPFDAGRALEESSVTLATEIVEQRRLELLADELWAGRAAAGTAAEVVRVPVLPVEVWFGVLGRALAGNPLGWLELTMRRGFGWMKLLRTLALAYGGAGRENRRLLGEVLRRPAARAALARAFDQHYYLSVHRDVLEAGLDPLLHYAVAGYRERRRPSSGFDAGAVERRWPELSAKGANPLLWVLLRETEG
jgi:glycosyltransferase involved in cell wall biosynthesis